VAFIFAGAVVLCTSQGSRAATTVPTQGVWPLILTGSAEALRKAQGLCLEMPDVRLAPVVGKGLGQPVVGSADDCIQHCRELVDCEQAVSDGHIGCHLYAATTSVVAKLDHEYRSAYCGMLTNMREMTSKQHELLHAIQARKTQGICVELPGLQLVDEEGLDATSSRTSTVKCAADCFEECRKFPSCKQAAFSESSGSCSFFENATDKVAQIGDEFRSAYCGELTQAHDMKALRERVQTEVRMRKAQGVCLDLKGIQLAIGDSQPVEELKTSAQCAERCRVLPSCAQAVFSEESSSCYHSMNASRLVAATGDEYSSSYCGRLEMTKDMKALKESVKQAIQTRHSMGICVDVEAVALKGESLVELHDLPSAAECFERCRVASGCGQAAFTQGSGRCNLFTEAVATVAHVGDAYASTYCGTLKDGERLKALRDHVKREVQMRRAMGVCEEIPGVQLADGKGGGSLVAFAPGVNATPAKCVEKCRREPQCAQAIFSRGNEGCYLFKEAAPQATHSSEIYYSAYCGEVKEAKRIQGYKQKVVQEVQMRKATGICKDMPGIQIADGSGHQQALFSNETGTPDKCIEACRVQLGCEQAVFSAGNRGCYMFETASDITALHESDIFHSAYCGDLRQVKATEARKEEIKRQVGERKAHGLCFEVPGTRAADGTSGALAEFSGNATQKKCMERCRTSLGCEEAVFSAKDSECHVFEKAVVDVFRSMVDSPNYHSAFCGAEADWKENKARQVKVQKMADYRKKSGACIDLPGVRLATPEGVNFYTWANNRSQCVEHCRMTSLCGQALYTNKSCRLFQNYTVEVSALGKAYHSARCSDWKDFARVKAMQNQTLKLMAAKIKE